MARPTLIERARLYLRKCPPSISGSGGHTACFIAAVALVKGFDLPMSDARALLHEWNQGCNPPWSEPELEHKLSQAAASKGTNAPGYLIGDDRPEHGSVPARPTLPPAPKPEFDLTALKKFCKGWDEHVDLLWLANRSALDPATVTTEGFLQALYAPGERVVLFTTQESQGWGVWPDDGLVTEGFQGVWFLAQPVDGKYHPLPSSANKEKPKMSRRAKESVTHFRFLVIESDSAPMRLWLGALAQLPLRIAAIYTSGKRSIHALVRVDCPTKEAWDAEKAALLPALVLLGADQKAMTAVRLTRLPGCLREETGKMQKLLYVNPAVPLRPLVQLPVVRDTETFWSRLADGVITHGPADSDETGGEWIDRGLAYYETVSEACAERRRLMKRELMKI